MEKFLQEYLAKVRGTNIDTFFEEQNKLILKLYKDKLVDCCYIHPWCNTKVTLSTNIARFEKELLYWYKHQSELLSLLALTKYIHNVICCKKRYKLGKKTTEKLNIIDEWFKDFMDHIKSFDDIKTYVINLRTQLSLQAQR